MNIKQILYEYVSNGWHVFPVKLDKTPYTEHGFKNATVTKLGIDEYYQKYPGCQWAGYFKNQYIVDIDVKHGVDGFKSLADMENKYGKLPETRRHKTGSGGLHIIMKQPDDYNIGNTTKMAGYPGIDRRGNGGYILLPPSRNETGSYLVLNDAPIALAPLWLLELQASTKVVKFNTVPGELVPQGQQDSWLFARARSYRGWGDTLDIIYQKLQLDVLRCKDQDFTKPYTDHDLMRIAKSASQYSVNEYQALKNEIKPLGTVPV